MVDVEIVGSTVEVTIDSTIPKVVEAIPNAVVTSGTTFTDNPVAGEDLDQYKYVVINSGQAFLASALTLDHATRVVGITMISALAGETVEIATDTFVTNNAWNWDITRPLLLGDNGDIVQTPLPTATFNLQVASTVSNIKIAVDIEEPTIL